MSKRIAYWLFFIGLIISTICIIHRVDRFSPINMTTKTCVITGASSGIGKYLAIEMVQRGWKVIGVARRAESLNELRTQLGEQNFIPFTSDVSNINSIHETSDQIKKLGLRPTLFFLNAGTGELTNKWEPLLNNQQQTFATNYFGALAWIDEWLLPVKNYGGGTFVATSSVAALYAMPGSDSYASSKAALLHSFDSLRRQYYYDNIQFSVILPGPVNTAMLKGVVTQKLPFVHTAEQEAAYIVKQVFAGKKHIEPSWFYATLMRLMDLLPDSIVLKF